MLSLDDKIRTTLKKELNTLIVARKWPYIAAWFGHHESEEELTHKVHLWGYLFMPDYFRSKGCNAHLELIRRFFSDRNEYTAFPRGFGKTTINQLCIAFSCVNHMDEFVPVIEKSWDEASNVLMGVRDVFEKDLTKRVYGEMLGKEVSGKEAEKMPDAKGDLFINGVRLRALGFNKTIRGLKHKAWRPTRIVVDDVETDEHIGNPDQRAKYMENYMRGIVPSLDRDGTVKVTGTILHFDSLLMNLVEQHDGLVYKGFEKSDPEGTILWPDLWDYNSLMLKKADMMAEGKGADYFYQEILNEPIGEEGRMFKWEWLCKEYEEDDLKFKELNVFATLDVADSMTKKADYTGVTIVGVDSDGNWYVMEVQRYKLDIVTLIERIFEIWAMDGVTKIGVEKKAYEDQIKPLLDSEASKRGIFPIVEELKHGGRRKIDRIRGSLQGKFKNGEIFFKKNAVDKTKLLKEELYSVSNDAISSKHDDLADALAYIDQISERPLDEEFRARYERDFEPRRVDRFRGIGIGRGRRKGARELFRKPK